VALPLTDGGGRWSTTASAATVDPPALVGVPDVTDQSQQTRKSPWGRGLSARDKLLL
jgi:hypothetical protein